MKDLEDLLRVVVPTDVSPDFNDAVMRRIHAEPDTLEQLLTVISNPLVPVTTAFLIAVALNLGSLTGAATALFTSAGGWLVAAPMVLVISWLLFRAFAESLSSGTSIQPRSTLD